MASGCGWVLEAGAAQAQEPGGTEAAQLWDEPNEWHESEESEEREEPAPAPGPSPLQPGLQLSAFTGYGGKVYGVEMGDPGHMSEAEDPLGFGVGLRARYQLAFGLSVGVRVSHHFGASDETTLGYVEAGWALPLGPLRGELFVGGGVNGSWSTSELCSTAGECTPVEAGGFALAVELGLTLAYPFADRYFVAATGETVALAGSATLGVSGYANVGVAF